MTFLGRRARLIFEKPVCNVDNDFDNVQLHTAGIRMAVTTDQSRCISFTSIIVVCATEQSHTELYAKNP